MLLLNEAACVWENRGGMNVWSHMCVPQVIAAVSPVWGVRRFALTLLCFKWMSPAGLAFECVLQEYKWKAFETYWQGRYILTNCLIFDPFPGTQSLLSLSPVPVSKMKPLIGNAISTLHSYFFKSHWKVKRPVCKYGAPKITIRKVSNAHKNNYFGELPSLLVSVEKTNLLMKYCYM